MHRLLAFLPLLLGVLACQAPEPSGGPARHQGSRWTAGLAGTGISGSERVYRTVGGTQLRLFVFTPERQDPLRPCIVFFFGGGWRGGTPGQFFAQCEFLAELGMVAISAEYRVELRHGVTPYECVADARSALRYVRANAETLNVDPDRIVAAGGSAGGHLAACLGIVPVPAEELAEEQAVSSRPAAMVLFNPVLDTGPDGHGLDRLGERWRSVSPLHNLSGAVVPPAIVFLGREDELIPVSSAERFQAAMEAGGNRCDLHLYEGQGHGFFNFEQGENPYFKTTLEETVSFLRDLGLLSEPPAVRAAPGQ